MSDARLEIDVQNGVADVLVFGPIGTLENQVNSKGFIERLEAMGDVSEINVRINSPGGSSFEAVAMYNALIKHPAKVVTINEGAALSAGSVVLMAGDERRMADNSLLMIHNPSTRTIGTKEEHERRVEFLDRVTQTITDLYAKRTGLSHERIAEMMSRETWLDANEAKQLNFVDVIVESKGEPTAVHQEAVAQFENHYEVTAMSETQDSPKSATLAELKSTFPNSTADWRETQLEANATLSDAAIAYAQHVEAKATAEREEHAKALADAQAKATATNDVSLGHDPMTLSGLGDGDEYQSETGDPTLDFNNAVAKLAGANPSYERRRQAVRTVANKHPELYQAYLLAQNPGKRQRRLIEEKMESFA